MRKERFLDYGPEDKNPGKILNPGDKNPESKKNPESRGLKLDVVVFLNSWAPSLLDIPGISRKN